MIFQELALQGAFLITLEKKVDHRGFFARTFCKQLFEKQGLCATFVQDSMSFSKKRGTVRGLHYQDPYPEIKLIQCLRGELFDVMVDIRKDSPTFGKWVSVTLQPEHPQLLYIPTGIAHGFQSLQDDTILQYKISEYYHPEAARELRWNDPTFNITWPLKDDLTISEKDAAAPFFSL